MRLNREICDRCWKAHGWIPKLLDDRDWVRGQVQCPPHPEKLTRTQRRYPPRWCPYAAEQSVSQ